MSKKMHGLAQYKNSQKEKKLAKRIAAAQKAATKKIRSAFSTTIDTGGILSLETSLPKDEALSAASSANDKSDVIAHRKALELMLYENMETPLEMLARCKYEISIDAEYHAEAEESLNVATRVICLDDNGFEMISRLTSLNDRDELAAGDTSLSSSEESDIERFLVSLPCTSEASQCGSFGQLLSVETGIQTTTHFTKIPSAYSFSPHWTDPAIIDYKIKQQPPRRTCISGVNSCRAMGMRIESIKHVDDFSRRIRTTSTPESSPTSTQRPCASSPPEFNAGSCTPPTPYYPSTYIGHHPYWGHSEPSSTTDWSRQSVDLRAWLIEQRRY